MKKICSWYLWMSFVILIFMCWNLDLGDPLKLIRKWIPRLKENAVFINSPDYFHWVGSVRKRVSLASPTLLAFWYVMRIIPWPCYPPCCDLTQALFWYSYQIILQNLQAEYPRPCLYIIYIGNLVTAVENELRNFWHIIALDFSVTKGLYAMVCWKKYR